MLSTVDVLSVSKSVSVNDRQGFVLSRNITNTGRKLSYEVQLSKLSLRNLFHFLVKGKNDRLMIHALHA